MAFQAKLPSDAVLKISNSGGQTHLTLQSDGKTQSSSVSSGEWKASPSLFDSSDGLILKIEGDDAHYTAIKDDSIQSLSDVPDLKDAKQLSLKEISDADAEIPHIKPIEPLKPMKPMAPMKPIGS
ncbi:hypothetical protein EON83_07235 [bacterium]|nr:MAG: hypothetical protein EON83_07235 [bacterium]